ncbi:conjugal transfer protein [Streptomyces harbinensis]|uniref:conjugal transfer protein n=1 Tax=Streptomyces harbinensis TaxID=1176198 RepID=UPI0036C2E311
MNATQTQGGGRSLSKAQKAVLTLAFVPMLITGVAGGIGTYTNIAAEYGQGTAVGAVAAGEGATAVLALVLLGLTMLGQSSPAVVRSGLWLLPAAASAMAVTAADDIGQGVIYAVTPMGMTVAAEGMAFLARRIVVHQVGRDVEAEARAAELIRELAYHRARATSHPGDRQRKASERRSWQLARKVGHGDPTLAGGLLDIQRTRLQSGADAALADMFGGTPTAPTGPVVMEDPTPLPVNAEESTRSIAKRSPSDLPEQQSENAAESAPAAPAVVPDSAPAPVPVTPDRSPRPAVAAADSPRPARVSAPVPPAARTPARRRDWDDLLTEAREATADWDDSRLTANSIRLAVRTSAENARRLRDVLKADRAESAGVAS